MPTGAAGSGPGAADRATSAASRRSRCTAASPTGSPRSAGCATTARRRCSWPRRPAAPSAPSSCSRNTTSSRCRSSAPKTRGTPRCWWRSGALSRGFRLPDAGLQIYAEADVFEEERRAPERRRSATKAFLSDLRDLKVGDLVVHVDHGIGMFVGLKQIGVGDSDAGVPRAALRRRGQAVRPGRAARSGPEIHRRHAAAGRSARRHVVGARQDARSRRPCATWPRSC